MKQWLYNGWCDFKVWVLYNYWRRFSNGDHDELLKFYLLKIWEKNAMKEYVEFHDGKKFPELESWYVGTIPHNYMERYNIKIKVKEND